MTAFTNDPLLAVLEQQTAALLQDAARLDDAALRAPSLLPGWTRGHVLAHLARNADGFANLARTAATGEPVPMYASRAARDADIERDATRPPAVQLDDLRETAGRLALALAEVPAATTEDQLPTGMGSSFRVGDLLWMRLREVAYHRVDLDAGTGFADLPDAVLQAGLLECRGRLDVGLTARCALADGQQLVLTLGDGGTAVSGPAGAVLGWLTGRTRGDGVRTDDGTALPDVPAWG